MGETQLRDLEPELRDSGNELRDGRERAGC